jgi:hypothetical protein
VTKKKTYYFYLKRRRGIKDNIIKVCLNNSNQILNVIYINNRNITSEGNIKIMEKGNNLFIYGYNYIFDVDLL